MFTSVTVVILSLVCGAQGHGYMLDPPARSSMWRVGFKTPINYNDMSINCGGYDNENFREKGKCGVCGDPYGQPQPRDNEAGGKYGGGVIAKHYQQGQDIHIAIIVTANYQGFFEFRLCKNDDVKKIVSQDCLDKNLLELRNADGTRYHLHGTSTGRVDLTAKLPTGLTCSQCVLQWKWHAANNYGRDKDNKECIGCGPQEEYYGCSDISIGTSVGQPQTPGPVVTPPEIHTLPSETHTQLGAQTPTPIFNFGTYSTCHSRQNWPGFEQLNLWCVENCHKGSCPPELCQCPDVTTLSPPIVHFSPSTPTVYIPPSTQAPPIVYVPPSTRSPSIVDVTTKRPNVILGGNGNNKPWIHTEPTHATGHGRFDSCHGVGLWGIGLASLDNWCVENCALGNCPSIQCFCPGISGGNSRTTSAPATTKGPTPAPILRPVITPGPQPTVTPNIPPQVTPSHRPYTAVPPLYSKCHGVNNWKGIPQLDEWCQKSCSMYYCPKEMCTCPH